MTIDRAFVFSILMFALSGGPTPALAQACSHVGADVTCDDGRRGVLSGNAIIPDSTARDQSLTHPGLPNHRQCILSALGAGVFWKSGEGKALVPLDDPNAPNKTMRDPRCRRRTASTNPRAGIDRAQRP